VTSSRWLWASAGSQSGHASPPDGWHSRRDLRAARCAATSNVWIRVA